MATTKPHDKPSPNISAAQATCSLHSRCVCLPKTPQSSTGSEVVAVHKLGTTWVTHGCAACMSTTRKLEMSGNRKISFTGR